MTPILAGGAALSSAVEGPADGAIAASVLGINGLVGGLQRQRTEKALERLLHEDRRLVRTLREGRPAEIAVGALVPGDIVTLEAGDLVPADLRLVEAEHLEADESSLTGESMPVRKSPAPSLAAAVADRASMLYEGTTVAAGSAVGVVVAVGENTESRRALAGEEEGPPATGVEARLDQITRYTLPAAMLSGLAVAAAGLVRGRPTRDMVGAGVALAIAAVPEGLPLLATMAQLAAARRLALQGALVRNPRAVEALGRVDVLCADKTGTLTEGRIRLRAVSDGETPQSLSKLGTAHRRVLATALRANPEGDPDKLPHPTDRALARGARRANVGVGEKRSGWRRVAELPFEPARGYHATLGEAGKSQWLCVKGAPEVVLPRCAKAAGGGRLDDDARARFAAHVDAMARKGLRVLAVAERRLTRRRKGLDDDAVDGLTFVGFVGLADPVRATAKQAVDDLKRAGVQVAMLTGDHPSTAEAIAAELGLLNGEPPMTGPELDRLDDDRLAGILPKIKVFARVTPAHKVRIVKAFQKAGRVVAMTGDGANDAPAIRLADVGIALGENSTPAARGAADLVVTDERIETIVHAILEGRALWSAVRDAVSILVGGNLGEIGFTLLGGLIDGSPPLNGRQLLLVNLLTDALPALAIALRRPRGVTPEQLLREGPDASLGEALTRDLAWRAGITSTAATAAWLAARMTGSRERASSVALLALVGTQLGQTLLAGGRSPSVLAAGAGSLAALLAAVETPGVSGFFGSTPVGPVGLMQAGVASAVGTGAAAVLPPIVDRIGPRVARTAVVKRLRASPWPRRIVRAFVTRATEEAPKGGGDWRRYVPFAGR
jgi:calcium-translocating P-type ATPase